MEVQAENKNMLSETQIRWTLQGYSCPVRLKGCSAAFNGDQSQQIRCQDKDLEKKLPSVFVTALFRTYDCFSCSTANPNPYLTRLGRNFVYAQVVLHLSPAHWGNVTIHKDVRTRWSIGLIQHEGYYMLLHKVFPQVLTFILPDLSSRKNLKRERLSFPFL